MQGHMILWWSGKSHYSLAGKFWFIHCIHQTLQLHVSIYFCLYKILLMEKISIPWTTVKGTGNSSLFKEIKVLGWCYYEFAWKMAVAWGTKWWIHFSIKFLVKKKKCHLFLLKNQRIFLDSPNIYWRLTGRWALC